MLNLSNLKKTDNKIQYIIFLLFTLIVFILLVKFFSESNIVNNKDVITISHESGFYDEPFYLTIKPNKKNIKIYYTFDCTQPTQKSAEYKEPILIKDATQNKNVYSARDDISSISLIQDTYKWAPLSIRQPERIPPFSVDKANIIRISVYNKNTNQLLYNDIKTYFIGFNKKKGYKNLPVVSLILEPDDLINSQKGIYVFGKPYNKTDSSQSDEEYTEKYLSEVNYVKKGAKWEKPVLFMAFDENKKLIFSKTLFLKIKGQISRHFPQKSFEIFSKNKKENLILFGHNFNNTIILDNSSTDIVTKIVDYLIQTMSAKSNLNLSTLKMIPCIVFLNGEYWGVYYISENMNRDYIHSHFNIKKNNILPVFFLADKRKFDDLYDKFLINENLAAPENYKKVSKIIDIDSFIDYYATEIYIANTDWIMGNNFAYWRSITPDINNKYADNKRRYMLFDLNFRTTLNFYDLNTFERAVYYYPIFRALLRNEDFREKLRNRMFELENDIYTPYKTDKFIDEYLKLMKEPLEKNNERFYGIKNYDDVLNKKINDIKIFFRKRPEYINKYMEKGFKQYE